jgi:hypothetical protein
LQCMRGVVRGAKRAAPGPARQAAAAVCMRHSTGRLAPTAPCTPRPFARARCGALRPAIILAVPSILLCGSLSNCLCGGLSHLVSLQSRDQNERCSDEAHPHGAPAGRPGQSACALARRFERARSPAEAPRHAVQSIGAAREPAPGPPPAHVHAPRVVQPSLLRIEPWRTEPCANHGPLDFRRCNTLLQQPMDSHPSRTPWL